MQERSLLDFWLILYCRRYSILAVIVFSVITALVGSKISTPIYEARASFFIPTDIPSISFLGEGAADSLAQAVGRPIHVSDLYTPYLGILKSERLAKEVHEIYRQKPLAKLLRADVDFELSDENILFVYARDHDPALAADIANAYVRKLNQLLAETSSALGARQTELLAAALDETEADLETAVAGLKAFEERNKIVELDSELEVSAQKKIELQSKLDDVEVQVAANRGKQDALEAEFVREDAVVSSDRFTITTPVTEHLRTALVDVTTELSSLETELGPNNVELKALNNSRREIEAQLAKETRNWLNSVIKPAGSHLEVLRQQLVEVVVEQQRLLATAEGYRRAISALENRLRLYPEIKAEFQRRRHEVEQLRNFQEQLRSDLREARLQRPEVRDTQVIVVDSADPPDQPVFPIWWLNLTVAIFGGTVVGVLYAFLLDYIDRTRGVRLRRLLESIAGDKDEL